MAKIKSAVAKAYMGPKAGTLTDVLEAARLDEHIRTARLERRKSRGMNLNLPNEPPSAAGSDEGSPRG